MITALRQNWPEYLMEAAGLGIFMISACLFTILVEHPGSPVRMAINDPVVRRFLIGVAMGLTAIAIIYSPWGKQSGAHINPSVTLTFLRLGKVKSWDAVFYIIAQFSGALLGVTLVVAIVRPLVNHPSVNYVATQPGSGGTMVAFVAELSISFVLMAVILIVSNTKKMARYTGIFAGILVATYITFEAPLSGMSMNPARTFGSAIPAHQLINLWVYFTAPILGMLLAAEVYVRVMGRSSISCAKLHHQNDKRCIHCGYPGAIKSAEFYVTKYSAFV
jgi:aquaporin Z